MWAETQPSTNSSFLKLKFENNCQKTPGELDIIFLKSRPILLYFFS